MKNIIEKNKIIAEFLNLTSQVIFEQVFAVCENGKTNFYKKDELKFHSDWNWLMEVVEKIESIEYGIYQVDILQEGCKILERCRLLIDNRVGKLESDTTKIESVYLACVEFIKWYNNKNKDS